MGYELYDRRFRVLGGMPLGYRKGVNSGHDVCGLSPVMQ